MAAVVADTHALVWYLAEPARLSATASAALDEAASSGGAIYVSAITVVELIYLVERGRLPQAVIDRFRSALTARDAEIVVAPVDQDVAWLIPQIPRDVVPELPDRVIAATALRLNVPLVTRDFKIRATGVATIW